jgi:hypothetical protein
MSLFGKIMASLNFVGVVAVFIMALLVYSRRSSWQYANYRHDLAVIGLPVTEDDTGDEAYKRVLDLGSPTGRTLKDLLPQNPVTTQEKEVKRVKETLDLKLAAVNDNRPLQMTLTAVTLLPLAETNARREFLLTIQTHCASADTLKALETKMQAAYPRAVARVKADPKKSFANEFALALRFPEPAVPVNKANAPPKGFQVFVDNDPRSPFEEALARVIQPDPNTAPNLNKPFDEAFNEALEGVRADLKQQYEAAFEEALKGTHSADGKTVPLSLEQRRHAVARLLVELDDSLPKTPDLDTDAFANANFKRVLTIIGLQEMNRELNAETVTLARISLEQDKQIERDRTAFVLVQQALVTEAQSAAQGVAQQDDQVKQLAEKVTAQTTLVAQRKKNVDDARTELAARRKYTSELLDIAQQMTDSIHKTRVEVRDANAVNQGYVEKIVELEKKRQ